MRELSAPFALAIAADSIVPVLLVYLDFAGDPFRAWSGLGTVEWAGEEWLGVGNLGEVGAIEEYSEVRAGSVDLRLLKIPGTALAEAGSLVYKRRAAEIHLGLLDGASNPPAILFSTLLFRGTMDTLELDRQPQSSSFTLTLANELARLKDSWGVFYTDTDQQRFFPGDTGLRFVPSLQDKQIRL